MQACATVSVHTRSARPKNHRFSGLTGIRPIIRSLRSGKSPGNLRFPGLAGAFTWRISVCRMQACATVSVPCSLLPSRTLYHIFFYLQTNVRFRYKKSSLHRMHFLIKQEKTPIHFVHITLYKQTGAFSQPAILKRSRYFFFCYPLFI